MEIAFYSQKTKSLSDAIKHLAVHSDSISIAVAYLSSGAIEEMRPYFTGKTVQILCGIHGCISDLRELSNLVESSDFDLKGRVFIGQSLFHSKLYIFKSPSDGTTLLIGSPNFTIGGLKTNEEIYIQVRDNETVQAITDAISYFDKLWNQESVPVSIYLSQHPDYQMASPVHEQLTPRQETILRSLTELAQRQTSFTFKNRVIGTLYRYGRQTIPVEFNELIDRFHLIGIGSSIPFEVVLPDGTTEAGKIRYGHSSWGYYYELGLRSPCP